MRYSIPQNISKVVCFSIIAPMIALIVSPLKKVFKKCLSFTTRLTDITVVKTLVNTIADKKKCRN